MSSGLGGGPLLSLSFSPLEKEAPLRTSRRRGGGSFRCGVCTTEGSIFKISAHRSRVLSRPSGDSVSVAVVPSSSALGDSGIADTLAVMWSFFNVDSTVTTRRLVEVRKNYFIPPEYKLHVPLPGERPYDSFPCGFDLSTDALEVGLRFPLHPVIKACLKQ
ncbi:hypothetical protein BHE74_00033090 [Ensete ventricosum]|uniref:Uncharacterized protein n=1 Tax=Ensete ventricosum TaxID=4639 RepID=A0A445MBE7_ENSVE|nr:hypothetical protein BHE74_00033090 [Ensete ventricosum]RZR71582.1 hypothetical protein BHM03_00005934 [Ensete ventricosum]